MQIKKPNVFQRILIKKTKISDKIKEKYKNSKEIQAIVKLVFNITLDGLLLTLGYLAFTQDSILIKIFGFGSLFWLIKEKIIDMITRVLGSFRLVNVNR